MWAVLFLHDLNVGREVGLTRPRIGWQE